MNKKLTLLAVAAAFCFSAQAQSQSSSEEVRLPGYRTTFEANKFWHNWFVSANFGANSFWGENSGDAKFKSTITFMPQIAVGKMFNPWLGVRLQGGGGSLHGFNPGANGMLHMHYMHVQGDVMLGLINFFAKYKEDRVFDLVPFVGIGGMTRKHDQSFTIHAGVQGKFRLSERFDANVEFQGLIFDDDMVVKGGFPNDGLAGLTAGITYYFKGRGFRVAPRRADMDRLAAENRALANKVTELENRPAQIKEVIKEVEVPAEAEQLFIPATIPFKFNSAKVEDIYEPLVYNIAQYMKDNKDAKVRIVGYADKFGTIQVNMRISQKRAEAIANMLTKEYGISADRLKVEYVGKEKPYYKDNNKWNRCAMIEIIK